MSASVKAVYMGLCHNCGGRIEEERLEKGLPCSICLPNEPSNSSAESIYRALKSNGGLKAFYWEYIVSKEASSFEKYFHKKTGSPLWSAQRSWSKRLIKGDSFAIIAPTGVGKSTLLTVYAAYSSEVKGRRVLYLVPTENLARQVASKLDSIAVDNYTVYYSRMPSKAKEESIRKIESGQASLLVVTTGFLSRRFDVLYPRYRFDVIIVDDVDSLLRNSKNVERLLLLAGFNEESVEAAYDLVKARIKLYRLLSSGAGDKTVSKLEQEIAELESKLRLSLESARPGQLVIASATGRPRGVKHLLFKELLGFEVGGGSDYLRNITDSYRIATDPIEEAARVSEMLGDGVLIFVSQTYGKEAAKRLAEKLRERGIPASLALTGAKRPVEMFAAGEAKVLIGMASRYGVIVRGLDLPQRSRYAVFVGVPARRVPLQDALYMPKRALAFLAYAVEQGEEWAKEYYVKLQRLVEKVLDHTLIYFMATGRMEAKGPAGEAAELLREVVPRLATWLAARAESKGGVLRHMGVVVESGGPSLVIPDPPTYIQASGRVSRLHRGVMTRGLSVIIDRSKEYIDALGDRLRWITSFDLHKLDTIDLKKLKREIEDTRKGKGRKVKVKTSLLVVESPTKARTIAWFWGRPGKRRVGRNIVYEASVGDPESGNVYILQITATRGHITDLTTDPIGTKYGVEEEGKRYKAYFSTIKKCLDCGHQYSSSSLTCPRCGSPRVLDSKGVVDILRKLASEVDEVIIATDPDREGEKIAWDVYLAVKPYNPNVKRGRFHEVSPQAVLEALRSASQLDRMLVEAQKVRRIVDRWIGFHLSSHLKLKFSKPWLGAGRVQTPVLGWIVERYNKWKEHKGYLIILELEGGGKLYHFTSEREEAQRLEESSEAVVLKVEKRVEEKSPPPPFTTDTLLYEASRVGVSARLAMRIAQDLFESGLITYHRTDSTRVSPIGMRIAKEYLSFVGMEEEYKPRTWGEGGAHEAIRPTRPLDRSQLEVAVNTGSVRAPIRLTRLHFKIYDMIFRRFIASQMTPSKVTTAQALFEIGGLRIEHNAVVDLDGGFATVLQPRIDKWLKNLKPGAHIRVAEVRIVRSSMYKLYKAGDVIQLMKQHGIGRPSTYAKAVEQNRRHGYIIESKRMKYLIPTKTGIEIYGYLSNSFSRLVSVETSRRLEQLLDKLERGYIEAPTILEEVWTSIEQAVQKASSLITSAEVGG
ncbi:MAG: reverse gyrase [Aeropyrum sp.]|nr:reverse gyrase [Aeropyrum sp.]